MRRRSAALGGEGEAADVRRGGVRLKLVAIGADGARGGWIAACLFANETTALELFPTIDELAAFRDRHGYQATVAIDVPIGLLDSVDFRPCDLAARERLRTRRGTVFASPARYMLAAAGDYPRIRTLVEEERRTNPAAKGLSAQAAGIAKKIKEVGDFVRRSRDSERWLWECHPELSFMTLSGTGEALPSKQSPAGRAQRIALVQQRFPDAEQRLAAAPWRAGQAGSADMLDAYAALVTAAAGARGEHEELGDGARDATGVPMRMAV